jgi:cytochrome o ubiquinol oxidase subunit 1
MIALVFGFAMIWHMWWLAGISFAGIVLASIIHTFNYKRDYYIPASEVVTTEEARTQLLARHV